MSRDQSHPRPPVPGERLTVTIEGLATGGDGIARVAGFTLFVPQGAPGDVAEVEIISAAPTFGRARLLRVVQPGPDRVPTTCPLAGVCPGCQLQHLRYEAQLAAKQAFVRDGLERIGRVKAVEVRPTLGADEPWQYRNKGEFAAERLDGQVRLGYRGEDGVQFVPLPDCPIQHPLSITILRAVEEVATAEGLPLAQLITRVSPDRGQALAILVCWEWSDRLSAAAEALRARVPELVGVLWSRVRGKSPARRTPAEVLTGGETLVQHLGDWAYTVSAESFFQVNNAQGARLLATVEAFAGDLSSALLLDGYCGVGTFLVPLALRANRATGIEEHPAAIRDAEANLARYAVSGVRLYPGRMEVVLPRLARRGREVDVAVIDPPRKGAGRLVLEALAVLGAKKIVLVSCDPATFGRDVGDLVALGYHLTAVQPIDMFPQTWHVEIAAQAERA